MKTNCVEVVDAGELSEFVRGYRGAALSVVWRILQNIPSEVRLMMIELQENEGWCIGIDILADKFGGNSIHVVGVSPSGERRVFAWLVEGSPKNAH